MKNTFNEKPWTLVLVVALGFFLVMVTFEYVRAKIYLSSSDDYKNSAKVLRVKALSDELNRASQSAPPAVYCNVSHKELIGEFNEAYDKIPDNKDLESLITELRGSVELARSPPAFNSVMQFIPKVHEARKISQEMYQSLAELAKLTSEDTRAQYCIELEDVLSNVYFLSSIETTEGVGALFVGQVENFQVNVKQALEKWAKIAPPSVFYDYHLEVGSVLNSVAVNLRGDTNNNEAFSRAIEKDVENLETTLEKIKNNSEDLLSRPGQIILQANFLE